MHSQVIKAMLYPSAYTTHLCCKSTFAGFVGVGGLMFATHRIVTRADFAHHVCQQRSNVTVYEQYSSFFFLLYTTYKACRMTT